MSLNSWFILLLVAIGQCVFLMTALLTNPLKNKKAYRLLLFLLGIVLCILASNAWTSGRLYTYLLFPSLFTRGMVLLLGPVIYLYVLALTRPAYSFRKKDWFHFMPYFFLLVLNIKGTLSMGSKEILNSIESLINGTAAIDTASFLQFLLYFVHLIFYLIIISRTIHNTLRRPKENYIIPVEQRISWLRNFNIFLGLLSFVFAIICLYILITRVYTIEGNIFYTLSLSLLVYMISYKAIRNNPVLLPSFDKKYASQKKANPGMHEETLARIIHLLEKEEIHANPGLTIQLLAQKAGLSSHLVSQVINERLGKNFTELLNDYRVESFKKKLMDPSYNQYSISGLVSEVGYQSKSTFYTAFKKITRQTPQEYIKSKGQGTRFQEDPFS